MNQPDPTAPITDSRRRWLRPVLSVRGLMVLTLLVAAGLGWYLTRVKVQRDAVAAIEDSGGHVYYHWQGHPPLSPVSFWRREPPRWLTDRVGRDLLGTVIDVSLNGHADNQVLDRALQLPNLKAFLADSISRLTDDHAVRLGDLTHLEEVWLLSMSDGRGLSGATLARFHQLTRLRRLDFLCSPTKDDELAPLAGLTSLRQIGLFQTGISNAGLVHLGKLVGLEHLSVSGNPLITSAGLVYLRRLTNLTSLQLTQTNVTDLSEVAGLSRLQKLSANATPITDANLAPLAGMTNLVELYLDSTAIGDRGLDRLEGLTNLRTLDISATQVSPARIGQFQLAHPKLKIVTSSPALPGPTPAKTSRPDRSAAF